MSETRPPQCRHRLQAEGKPYPRTGCAFCAPGKLKFTCDYLYTSDAMAEAAKLLDAAEVPEEGTKIVYPNDPVEDELRLIADDPMWSDHAEVRKDKLIAIADHISELNQIIIGLGAGLLPIAASKPLEWTKVDALDHTAHSAFFDFTIRRIGIDTVAYVVTLKARHSFGLPILDTLDEAKAHVDGWLAAKGN